MKTTRIIFFLFFTNFLVAFSFIQTTKKYPFSLPGFFPAMPQSTGNPVTEEGADLGRHLFYDDILSYNRDMSCASCHKQQYAFSDGSKALSEGRNGMLTKRNAMAIFNLAWSPSFFWDGRASSVEELVYHPVRDENEMNLKWETATLRVRNSKFYVNKFKAAFGNVVIDSTSIAKAIGQFLRTLLSYQSKYDRVLAGDDFLTDDEYSGFILMNDMTKGNCLHCHTTDADPIGTTGKISNNGLDSASSAETYADKGVGGVTGNEEDYGKFKIPSLRNVAVTGPYMHDGRFHSLEKVLDFYSEGVNYGINVDPKMMMAHRGMSLTKKEKAQIVTFLKTLTDSSFLTNPAFSNPFTSNLK